MAPFGPGRAGACPRAGSSALPRSHGRAQHHIAPTSPGTVLLPRRLDLALASAQNHVRMFLVNLTLFWNEQAPGAPGARPQAAVERRCWAIMVEFPELSDEEVALLVHDEIVNAMGYATEYLAWATAQTVARLRRTAVISYIRDERARGQLQQGVSPEVNQPRACRQCHRTNPSWATECQTCSGGLVGDEAGVFVRNCPGCRRRVRKAATCGACGTALA